jgi:hypothetical protein
MNSGELTTTDLPTADSFREYQSSILTSNTRADDDNEGSLLSKNNIEVIQDINLGKQDEPSDQDPGHESIKIKDSGNASDLLLQRSDHDEKTEFHENEITFAGSLQEKPETNFASDFVQNQTLYFEEEKMDHAGIQNSVVIKNDPESYSGRVEIHKDDSFGCISVKNINNNNNNAEKLDKRNEKFANVEDLHENETTDTSSGIAENNIDTKLDHCLDATGKNLNESSHVLKGNEYPIAAPRNFSRIEEHQNDNNNAADEENPESDPVLNKSNYFKDSESCLPMLTTIPNQEETIMGTDTYEPNTNPQDKCATADDQIDNSHFTDDTNEGIEELMPYTESERSIKSDKKEFQADVKNGNNNKENPEKLTSDQISDIKRTEDDGPTVFLSHDSFEEKNCLLKEEPIQPEEPGRISTNLDPVLDEQMAPNSHSIKVHLHIQFRQAFLRI